MKVLRLSQIEQVSIAAARKHFTASRAVPFLAIREGIDLATILQALVDYSLPELVSAMKLGFLRGWSDAFAEYAVPLPKQDVLSFALHDKAVEFLRKWYGLTVGQLTHLEDSMNAQGLRVLRASSAIIEKRLQRVVQEVVSKGYAQKQAKQVLRAVYSEATMSQLETLYRSQVQLAHSAGRWNAEQDPAIQEILWGYKYVVADYSERTRPNHRAMDGVTLPKEDAFWETAYPPNGWNCRCRAIPILDKPRREKSPKVGGGPDIGWDYNPGKIFSLW